MKNIQFECRINKPDYFELSDDESSKLLEELIQNMIKLHQLSPEYKLNRFYGKSSTKVRSVTIVFPYEEVVEFYKSGKEYQIIHIGFIVHNDEIGNDVYNRVAFSHFKLFLFDLFISLNIASPGSFEYYSWEILNFSEFESFRTHSFFFLMARQILTNQFNIELENKIEEIFSKIRSTYTNHDTLPDNALKKSINALLHLSIDWQYKFSPESGLLITYSIESLIGNGIPRSLLVKRVCNILEVDDVKKINKILKSIYDWRNKIVHGEYKLPHPAIYDASFEFSIVYSEYTEILETGFALVLCLIKKLIENKSSEYLFEEKKSYLK